MTIPKGTTHQWVPEDGFHHPMIQRLRYYHKDESGYGWMVYSEITGWRHSKNTLKWFETETELGFFKEIE